MALDVLTVVICSWAEIATAVEESAGFVANTPGVTEVTAVPVAGKVPTGLEAACGNLLDEVGDVSVCVAEIPGEVFRGVGKRIGVTATTIAVSNSAIKSLLSIYGTGSKPPGRKG
jgi:hypothetical protein